MREIVMDTETTGFDPMTGDRMVEIGCVELMNHMPTGRTYHQYINPKRDMPDGAFQVHGLSEEFLRDFPVFEEIADAFLEFIGTSKLVIHNAKFDVPFLNAELGWCKRRLIPDDQAIDTLMIARKKFPGAGNSLDALCRRFGIDNSHRELHGALLDSEILAEVYLELIGGRQPDLVLGGGVERSATSGVADSNWRPRPRPDALPPRLTETETSAHEAFVEKLGENALWKRA
ncbi:DNA polymerase III subunit epsilon [Maritimibacter dapengensis]|uniref:DNA polymerase III subunit epsilon n=1 Tax=Maritimibacter dapengensis TaxID=2836868 RepID=A0ABS6T4A0_9RHOB|nr:DNA polymerase III subunit epsilon [Maritimibacter dapengensis]MBV7380083.1 DNA polymerase III subunit epsilon [Maritimibacter dapengensis]